MTDLRIERPTPEFMAGLAADMRQSDRLEVEATTVKPVLRVLEEGLAVSDLCWGATLAGRPAAMWGVRPAGLLGGLGCPWVLTGCVVTRHPKIFLQVSRDVLSIMHLKYPVLMQAVDVRYAAAIAWVRRLGFTVGETITFGIQERPFVIITSRRS